MKIHWLSDTMRAVVLTTVYEQEKKKLCDLVSACTCEKKNNQTKQPPCVRAHEKLPIYKALAVLCLILLHIRDIFHIQIWLTAISSQDSSCPVWLTDCSQIHCFTKGVSRTLISIPEKKPEPSLIVQTLKSPRILYHHYWKNWRQ